MSEGAPGTDSDVGVLRRLRRVLIWALLAALVYSALATGSVGTCPGGFSSDGGYIDSSGSPTDVAPHCVTITVGPSPLILGAIAVILLVALTRMIRGRTDGPTSRRILDRALLTVIVLVLVSIVAVQAWIRLVPIDAVGSGTVFFPFPFGSAHLVTTPMEPPAGS